MPYEKKEVYLGWFQEEKQEDTIGWETVFGNKAGSVKVYESKGNIKEAPWKWRTLTDINSELKPPVRL
jgi:hypothetical protein